jgi:hypothetical protein
MPRGEKSAYTTKQRRRARHIEEGYEKRGVSRKEAARRAWATEKANRAPSRKGGKKGGRAAASRPKAARSASARKAAATRKRRAS